MLRPGPSNIRSAAKDDVGRGPREKNRSPLVASQGMILGNLNVHDAHRTPSVSAIRISASPHGSCCGLPITGTPTGAYRSETSLATSMKTPRVFFVGPRGCSFLPGDAGHGLAAGGDCCG